MIGSGPTPGACLRVVRLENWIVLASGSAFCIWGVFFTVLASFCYGCCVTLSVWSLWLECQRGWLLWLVVDENCSLSNRVLNTSRGEIGLRESDFEEWFLDLSSSLRQLVHISQQWILVLSSASPLSLECIRVRGLGCWIRVGPVHCVYCTPPAPALWPLKPG